MRGLDMLIQTLKPIVHFLQNLNYKYKLHAFKSKNYGVKFKSYNLSVPLNRSLAILISEVAKNETVYDVGAYYGKFTLSLAAKGCTVYAFEPNSDSFEKLCVNVRANNFSNVEHLNIGLSKSRDVLPFFVSSDAARSSFQRYNATYGNSKIVCTKSIKVEALDNLVEQNLIKPPNYIKIDAEGHELEVLIGAAKAIEKYHPVLHLEPHEVRDGDLRYGELEQFFQKTKYQILKYPHLWVCKASCS